jgi:hypothetical protein
MALQWSASDPKPTLQRTDINHLEAERRGHGAVRSVARKASIIPDKVTTELAA